jgi:hypothetical protein
MLSRNLLLRSFYVKPAVGYVSSLPARGENIRESQRHLEKTGHAVPRRTNLLDLEQHQEQVRAAAAAAETMATMENNWTSESTETIGVNEETYAKWFCQHYNLSRDEYESLGCPNTNAGMKELYKNCDADNSLVAECQHAAVEAVGNEIYEKKINRRFWNRTLTAEGEPVEEVAVSPEQEVSDAPRLE